MFMLFRRVTILLDLYLKVQVRKKNQKLTEGMLIGSVENSILKMNKLIFSKIGHLLVRRNMYYAHPGR